MIRSGDGTSSVATLEPGTHIVNGTDGFTITINDCTVGSAASTVSITVDSVNDIPSL